METTAVLRQLSEAVGPPGYEAPVAELIERLWRPYVDELRRDPLGNLIARRRGSGAEPRPVLLLAAHMDEIALLVSGYAEAYGHGYLRIEPIGGIDRRVLLGQRVWVHPRDGEPLPGLIATPPPHILSQSERKKVPSWDHLFIDPGLPIEQLEARVRIGDPITFRADYLELKNRRVAGKAFDNRVSVAVVTLALAALRERTHAWDIVAVATVQEEVGLYGATTAAYGVAPTAAVALDGTFARQHDVGEDEAVALDGGPAIGVGPNFHPYLVDRLKEVAEHHEITHQIEAIPRGSGTDAWAIQVSREGIPTALLSVPMRYMHQPVELLSLRDVERAARLLTEFIADLRADERPVWEDEHGS